MIRVALAALLALVVSPGAFAEPGTVSVQELAALMTTESPPLIVDVRTPGEFADGHVPDALNAPVSELSPAALPTAPDEPVVVYCKSGRRAARAAEQLRAAGFSEVLELDGSMQAWRRSEQPVAYPIPEDTP